MASWDAIIVGQGLAGTTLAWHLRAAGQRVLVVDRAEAVTSSKIAAGLITPITGQRLALSWRVAEFLPKAREFYQSVEQLTKASFFHERPAIRLFSKDDERQRWVKRKEEAAFQAYLSESQPVPLIAPALFSTTGEGFEMNAAQLDVPRYLEASRTIFENESLLETSAIDWENEIHLTSEKVTWRDHSAARIISCEGFAAAKNPHFQWVRYKAAKGEILTVKFSQPLPPQCIHRGLWMAPTADPSVWRVGSTYDWHQLDQLPTEAGKESIETRLRELIQLPWQLLKHEAAVRPIIHESKALVGLHPAKPALGYFNGLGSKGSLHAPWFAEVFANFLVAGLPIEEGADIRKNF